MTSELWFQNEINADHEPSNDASSQTDLAKAKTSKTSTANVKESRKNHLEKPREKLKNPKASLHTSRTTTESKSKSTPKVDVQKIPLKSALAPTIKQRQPIPYPLKLKEYHVSFTLPDNIPGSGKTTLDRYTSEIIAPGPKEVATPSTSKSARIPLSNQKLPTKATPTKSATINKYPIRSKSVVPDSSKGKRTTTRSKSSSLNSTTKVSRKFASRSKTGVETSKKVKKSRTSSKENISDPVTISDSAASVGTSTGAGKLKRRGRKAGAAGAKRTRSKTDDNSRAGISTADAIALTASLAETSIPIQIPKKRSLPKLKENNSKADVKEVSEKEKENDITIKAPRFNFEPNTPMPGTKEWNEYWKGYHKALAKFDGDMQEFHKGLNGYDDVLQEYHKEAKRISDEERQYKAGLDLVGTNMGYPGIAPPPMKRVPIQEKSVVFNGYVISSRRIEGTISNQLGKEGGISIQVKVGTSDPDDLKVERDAHFFTLSFGNKKHFLHLCVPPGMSTNDIVMKPPLGGFVFIEGS